MMAGEKGNQAERRDSAFGSALRAGVLALVAALVVRAVLLEAFSIPSGSMKATLLVGDYVLVSKYTYGFSRYSLPFAPPWLSGRIFGAAPERGDVVVFRYPRDDSIDYVKRVIGLPGDHIKLVDGLIFINGKSVKRQRVDDFIDDEGAVPQRVRRWRETLPNGASYQTLDLEDNGPLENTDEYVVPKGHYFMMGDNRDDSADSRVLTAVGYVPYENLIGKARVVFFSIGNGERGWHVWNWPVRWGRLFTLVQ